MTARRTTANTSTRLCRGHHKTATASTRTCLPYKLYHMTEKWSPSSNGSHGQGHGQAPKLQTTKEQPKCKNHGAFHQSKNGQWANGIKGRIKNPTITIEFIFQHEVLAECMKDVTYGQFVCLVRPKKAELSQIQFMVIGDRINYPGKVATQTAEMLVAKILFNSVIPA